MDIIPCIHPMTDYGVWYMDISYILSYKPRVIVIEVLNTFYTTWWRIIGEMPRDKLFYI